MNNGLSANPLDPMRVGVLVPTLNAGPQWSAWIAALQVQTAQVQRVLVIDSASTDDTVALASKAGYEVLSIDRSSFDHGGTRQLGIRHLHDCDIVVCLTQDAILADPHALAELLSAFANPHVAVAYGRQLPHADANPLAAHARHFNYPATSRLIRYDDRAQLGVRAAFCSNSFSAWRRLALLESGGFPTGTLLGEDMQACARLLMAGHSAAYVATAPVQHSHNYHLVAEFRRYFDTGAMHTMTPWLGESFGNFGGEGLRYVRAEWRALAHQGLGWRCRAVLSNGAKWIGYQVGRRYRHLPHGWCSALSMHPAWWRQSPHR